MLMMLGKMRCQPGRDVSLAGAGRAEEHHVLAGGGEVQGADLWRRLLA